MKLNKLQLLNEQMSEYLDKFSAKRTYNNLSQIVDDVVDYLSDCEIIDELSILCNLEPDMGKMFIEALKEDAICNFYCTKAYGVSRYNMHVSNLSKNKKLKTGVFEEVGSTYKTTYRKSYNIYKSVFGNKLEFYKTEIAKKIAECNSRKYISSINKVYGLYFFYMLNALYMYCQNNDCINEFEEMAEKKLYRKVKFLDIINVIATVIEDEYDFCEFVRGNTNEFIYNLHKKAENKKEYKEYIDTCLVALDVILAKTVIIIYSEMLLSAMREKYDSVIFSECNKSGDDSISVIDCANKALRISEVKKEAYEIKKEPGADYYDKQLLEICNILGVSGKSKFKPLLKNILKMLKGHISDRRYRENCDILRGVNPNWTVNYIREAVGKEISQQMPLLELKQMYLAFCQNVKKINKAYKNGDSDTIYELSAVIYQQAYYILVEARKREREPGLNTKKISDAVINILNSNMNEEMNGRFIDFIVSFLEESVYFYLEKLHEHIWEKIEDNCITTAILFRNVMIRFIYMSLKENTVCVGDSLRPDISNLVDLESLDEVCQFILKCSEFISQHIESFLNIQSAGYIDRQFEHVYKYAQKNKVLEKYLKQFLILLPER